MIAALSMFLNHLYAPTTQLRSLGVSKNMAYRADCFNVARSVHPSQSRHVGTPAKAFPFPTDQREVGWIVRFGAGEKESMPLRLLNIEKQ
jgi:hypothetical protein